MCKLLENIICVLYITEGLYGDFKQNYRRRKSVRLGKNL